MTIHQDPIIAMQLVPYAVRTPIPDAIQDDLREAMLFDAKRMPKLRHDSERAMPAPETFERMAAAKRAKGDATFTRLWPAVRDLKAAGLSNVAVAREIGTSEGTVKRVLARGQNANLRVIKGAEEAQ